MEEQWIVDRCRLRAVWLEHPEWSKRQLAEAIGHSKSWVKKWLKRIRNRPLEDRDVLQGYSRARKRPPPGTVPEVVTRILELRDDPPPKLGRVPGPVTILYYLRKDKSLTEAGCVLPRSTRTVWKILDRYHRIARPGRREHEELERLEPGVEWGMDFHDVSTVPADPLGKKQHVVEILNLVDHGSSAVVASEPGDAYTAETALRTVAQVFLQEGCPDRIDLDRDPRWVSISLMCTSTTTNDPTRRSPAATNLRSSSSPLLLSLLLFHKPSIQIAGCCCKPAKPILEDWVGMVASN
jgi:hypothetical protein